MDHATIIFSSFSQSQTHRGKVYAFCAHPPQGYSDVESWSAGTKADALKSNLTFLAPSWPLVSRHKYQGLSDAAYIKEYKAQLAAHKAAVRAFVESLIATNATVTLCCFCPPGKFCHRHVLAGWFRQAWPELEVIEF